MTARKTKPKPKPRKASGPTLEQHVATLEQRVATIEGGREFDQDWLEELDRKIKSIEARANLRDKSHDEPVSNAGEAIGQHFRIVGEVPASWWRRLIGFMGTP